MTTRFRRVPPMPRSARLFASAVLVVCGIPIGAAGQSAGPAADAVSPASGTGASQRFALRYSDPSGAVALTRVWVWFTEEFATTAELSCLAYYDRPANTVALIDDTGTSWRQAVLGGGTTRLENGRCAIDVAATSVTLAGNTLTWSLPVSFEPRADGTTAIYMFAEGVDGASGWQPRGTWTVPSLVPDVSTESVTPLAGTGRTGTFTLQYSDTSGAGHLTHVWVWFAERFATSAAGTCLAYYEQASHRVFLLNDAGTGWLSAAAGESGVLQSSQCAVVMGGVVASVAGQTLTVTLPIVFAPAYSGAKNIYVFAAADGGRSSAWERRGTWTIPPPGGAVVTADAVLPAAGTGTSRRFDLLYSHSAGAAALDRVWVWFSETFATTAELSCLVYYDRAANTMSLVDNTGMFWHRAVLGGDTASLQNSRCAIDVAATAVTLSGSTLILSLPVSFEPRADGIKTVYMFADGAEGTSGWQPRGTWTVPALASDVTPVMATGEGAIGALGTFSLQYSHALGADHLTQAWVWFVDRFAASGASTCMAYYEVASHRLYLLNDAGTAWLSAVAGQGGALQNSQCAIVTGGAAAATSGDTLTLSLPVVFAPTYSGVKSIYMFAAGGPGHSSVWERRGTWTVPASPVSLAADRPAPQWAGVSLTWTAAAGGASSPEYKFWQWDGTVWSVLRDWGSDDTLLWSPPGPADYRVAVWVRTNGSALDVPQRYTSAAFRITPRVSATVLTVSPASAQLVNHPVALSATASGGLAPYEFQFKVRGATGDWTIVRDWAAGASVAWVPSAVGSYTVGVYARSGGASGNMYEAADFKPLTVNANCAPNTIDGPMYVPENGGNVSIWIDVHPTCQWTASTGDTTWLELASPASGYGPGAVIVRATPNGGETRNAAVSFRGRTVGIVQQGFDYGTCTWSIEDRGKTYDSGNHGDSVYVNAPPDCQWRVTRSGDFIRLTGAEARTGPGRVYFDIENNTTTTLRRGVLRLDGRLMMVTQYGIGGGADAPGCTYHVMPLNPPVGPGNGQHRVWVATGAGCPWSAQSGGWVHAINGTSRAGSGWLDYSVENNTAPATRTGVMTVAGRTVTVTQAPVDGCDYRVEPAFLDVSSGNHDGAISVTANDGCSWSAERTGPFIHLTGTTSGASRGTVPYRIENNTTTTPRAGELRIAGISIPVSQMAVGDCTYQVTPLQLSLDSGNHQGSVSVFTRADCQWRAASETGFLAVASPAATRTGPGEVAYTAENNTSAERRTGFLQVAGQRVTVTQLAAHNCTIALDPAARDARSGGETFTLHVITQAGCSWQASTTTPSVIQLWGDLTQSGPGSIDVEVENHTSFSSRSGMVRVNGETLTVRQSGVCDPTVQPLERTVGGAAGESYVDVTTGADCVWTAASNASFLHVATHARLGPERLVFTFDANLDGAARVGTLTIAGHTVTVMQLAASDPAGAFDPSRDVVRFYHTDAIGSVRLITDMGGQVVERLDYRPFGEPWPASASSAETRRFAGKERDSQTGLDYFGARYYASRWGRFTTVDPGHVNGDIYDPESWNGYAYARNNPLKYMDPTGTMYEICAEGAPRCERVSDQYFAILQRNPGAGIRLAGGDILVGGRVVGSYNQISRDPTLADFIFQTGQLSAVGLKYGSIGIGIAAAAGPGAIALSGAAGSITLGVSRLAPLAPLAGQLNFTNAALRHMSEAGRRVPIQTLAEAIGSGRRMPDPQGAAGAVKIVQQVFVNGTSRRLEIIYREADKTILHFLYK